MIYGRWVIDGTSKKEASEIFRKVFVDELDFKENIINRLLNDNLAVLVVYEDSLAAAAACAYQENNCRESCCHIAIAVLESMRRKGIGDLAARMLIRRVYNMGIKTQFAYAIESCEAFYKKLGFLRIDASVSNNMTLIKMSREGDIYGNC